LAWRFSATTNCFEPAASLVGHQLAVVSLVVGGMRLYSASMDKTIKVCETCSLPLTLIFLIDSINIEYIYIYIYICCMIASSGNKYSLADNFFVS
jgi:hypothetical protein